MIPYGNTSSKDAWLQKENSIARDQDEAYDCLVLFQTVNYTIPFRETS